MAWLVLTREDNQRVTINMDKILQIEPWKKAGQMMTVLVSDTPGKDGLPYSIVVRERMEDIIEKINSMAR